MNILIVTSYNPETRSISDNLSAFMDEYRQRGGKYTPIIERQEECALLEELKQTLSDRTDLWVELSE